MSGILGIYLLFVAGTLSLLTIVQVKLLYKKQESTYELKKVLLEEEMISVLRALHEIHCATIHTDLRFKEFIRVAGDIKHTDVVRINSAE